MPPPAERPRVESPSLPGRKGAGTTPPVVPRTAPHRGQAPEADAGWAGTPSQPPETLTNVPTSVRTACPPLRPSGRNPTRLSPCAPGLRAAAARAVTASTEPTAAAGCAGCRGSPGEGQHRGERTLPCLQLGSERTCSKRGLNGPSTPGTHLGPQEDRGRVRTSGRPAQTDHGRGSPRGRRSHVWVGLRLWAGGGQDTGLLGRRSGKGEPRSESCVGTGSSTARETFFVMYNFLINSFPMHF